MALSFRPQDARAQAKAADLLIGDLARYNRPGTADEVRRRAALALGRDPTIPAAWRLAGMTSRDPATVSRLFHIAESMSRRDLPTQLWLIEERVQSDDIRGALRHYDIALRTSSASLDILLPILVNATADRSIIGPLGQLLRTPPPWRSLYLERLAASSPQPENLARLMEIMGPTTDPQERASLTIMMGRLVNERHFAPAERIYALLAGAPVARSGLLRNGNFQAPNPYPPFSWQLESGADIGADIGLGGSGSAALRAYAGAGLGGVVARQLLVLPPGRYRLRALTGPGDDGRPASLYWRVTCGNADGTQLVETGFPPASGRARPQSDFQVPTQGCPAQWLQIGVRSDFGPGSVSGWVDDIVLARAG